jgi:potassium-transporting ATPase KdpC subunit
MLTASGSGLDPDISPADAALQVARVAQARGIRIAEINGLLQHHISGRSLGIFGEPRVNVLALNLALDEKYPKSSTRLRVRDQAP